MLGLPKSTEVKRPLPKAQLYKRFDWKPSQRECFDGDVSRLDFVNWIAPRTLPAIAEGSEVKEIFVIEVTLKTRDFDQKNIILLAKSIPQRVIYLLRYEVEAMIAVYHSKLFTSPWKSLDSVTVELSGLNLDAVWQSIVSSIGQFSVDQDKSLTEQIKVDEEHEKLHRQIAAPGASDERHQTTQTKKESFFLNSKKLKQQ